MCDDCDKYLSCGCFIRNGYVWRYCDGHFHYQPAAGDPLDVFFKERENVSGVMNDFTD